MFGRRLGVAAVLVSAMLFTTAARAEEECSADLARGTYLMRAGLLVEAREAMLRAGDRCAPAREHAADLAWRIPKAFLHVTGRPADEVTILVDGNVIDRKDARNALRLNPGEHVFVARTAGGGERHVTFFLAEGETRSVAIDFTAGTIVPAQAQAQTETRSSASVSPLVWVGFGLAALGLAVGTGAALASMAKARDVESQCASAICPPSVRDDLDSAHTYGTISTVAFVGAAAGATVGILGLTIWKETPKRETSARVSVGPASVGVAGTF